MAFYYLKAVHIIFVVTWFAGLFYMPRLLVYMTEAHERTEPEKTILLDQLRNMASRLLFGITWPSAVITLVLGVSLLVSRPDFLKEGFMHVKLLLVALLYGYHFSLQYIFNQLKTGVVKYSSQQLRIWNEVPTLFLFSIVFIIVLKSGLSMIWGIAGVIVLTVMILAGIRIYKKFRE